MALKSFLLFPKSSSRWRQTVSLGAWEHEAQLNINITWMTHKNTIILCPHDNFKTYKYSYNVTPGWLCLFRSRQKEMKSAPVAQHRTVQVRKSSLFLLLGQMTRQRWVDQTSLICSSHGPVTYKVIMEPCQCLVLAFQWTKALTDHLLLISSHVTITAISTKSKKELKCLLTKIFRLNSHPRYFPTDVANTTVECIRGMLRSLVIEVSGEIDTRPWEKPALITYRCVF